MIIGELKITKGSRQAVSFGPRPLRPPSDSGTLGSGSADNTVRLWDVASGRELHKLEGHFGLGAERGVVDGWQHAGQRLP